MRNLVVITGAGMSAESGIKTFRDHNGLWEEHNVEDVATPEGWKRNPELVNKFYNERRKQLLECNPNLGHKLIAELEENFNVNIITQNIDNLHERAGSTNVLHLHGELNKVRSSIDENDIMKLTGWELKIGDKCKRGSQLRPHIVWFGETVPEIDNAVPLVMNADIIIIVGTSMAVYPAAGLVNYSSYNCPIFLIDPNIPDKYIKNVSYIQKGASEGIKELKEKLAYI
ncbi:MAG: NAD-dependent deacylase [Marinifilaceae bacterium]